MLKPFTLRFDRSEYFDRAHVRGLGFLVGARGYLGVTFEGTGGTEKHQYASRIKGQKEKNLRHTTGYA